MGLFTFVSKISKPKIMETSRKYYEDKLRDFMRYGHDRSIQQFCKEDRIDYKWMVRQKRINTKNDNEQCFCYLSKKHCSLFIVSCALIEGVRHKKKQPNFTTADIQSA